MAILVDHLERRLGHMNGSWSGVSMPGHPAFNVGRFQGGTFTDVTCYVTLGLSRVPLHRTGHDRHFLLEFLVAVRDTSDASRISLLTALESLWLGCIESRRAILRGEIVALPQEAVLRSRFSFFYAALPVYYDDEFKSVALDSEERAAIVWLVPLTSGEAAFVWEKGWERFEAELARLDPDLMDLDRAAIA